MLELSHIDKSFSGAPILRDISLSVATGEIVCLLGPSGSGKTTLLRIVAGLETADSGTLAFDGRDLRAVPVHTRGFGLMFQELALFPHRDVFENVAFGLRMLRLPRPEIEARVRESLALVGLGAFTRRDVNLLSGGEQQRVALARSLAPRPRLLMFDEPLGALDRLLREQLIADVRAILKHIGMTALYVTHDQDEATAVADRIAILHEGRIAQLGTPEELYRAPANEFVARFLNLGTVLRAQWLSVGVADTPLGQLRLAAPSPSSGARGGTEAMLLIRPERVRIMSPERAVALLATVTHCAFLRGVYRLTVEVNGVTLRLDSAERRNEGELVRITLEPEVIVG